MAFITLILPLGPGAKATVERIEPFHSALEELGHRVEVIGVRTQGEASPGLLRASWWREFVLDEQGASRAAFRGIEQANGEILILLDLNRSYRVEDVLKVLAPLEQGTASLVVASRGLRDRSPSTEERGRAPSRLKLWSGALSARFLKSTDPCSGLVALTRELGRSTTFYPIGQYFSLELLARTEGTKLDVPVADRDRSRSRGTRIGLDDLRLLKRLGDDQFGNFSRLLQFCVVGATGMIVDLSTYALFQWILGGTHLATREAPIVGGSLALAVSGAIAIAIALTWNFTLNRRLTFSYARSGSLIQQYLRYAFSNALGIALSFLLRLTLPRHVPFFDRHRLAAAVVGIVAATGISFTMARWFVFSRRPGSSQEPTEARSQPELSAIEEAERPSPHFPSQVPSL